MTRLLITGEGYPVYRVIEAVLNMPGASVAAVVLGSTSSVKAEALAKNRGLRVLPLSTLRGQKPIPEEVSADWLININGTTIIAPDVIALFPRRAINMHPGLLPQYAGLHCHQWAIRNGEDVQGFTVHLMDEGIDTGPILTQKTIAIFPDDTGLSLFRRTIEAGTDLLIEVLGRIVSNDIPLATKQDTSHRRLYRHKDAMAGDIDWTWRARTIVDFVRAANYDPFTCPTYTPKAVIAGVKCTIRACKAVYDTVTDTPGKLLSMAAEGPIVATGFGEAIQITRALQDNRIIDADKWLKLLELPR